MKKLLAIILIVALLLPVAAFADDFVKAKWFRGTVYEYTAKQRKEIETLLAE